MVSFTIDSILEKFKPKVGTFENTPGLICLTKVKLDARYQVDSALPRVIQVDECWGKILRQLTSRGYSIRWGIMRFEEFGLAQSRECLILIASG